MSLKLVPWNSAWISHDKLDVHAIYRRPRFKQDDYGEIEREYDDNGIPTWDLTGPLPVRSHVAWLAKGFEYVTLADRVSLIAVARQNTLIGGSVAEYDQHQTGGPWNYKKYIEGMSQITTREAEKLRSDVEKYGSEVVEEIRRQTDAAFTLPAHMRNIPAGGVVVKPIMAAPVPVMVSEAALPVRPKQVPWNKGKKRIRTEAPPVPTGDAS